MAMTLRGINYDVGTHYDGGSTGPGRLSMAGYDIDRHLHTDLAAIASDLHCNAVQLYGTDIDTLVRAGEAALGHGLSTWIQPRLVDATPAEQLAHLREAARGAAALQRRSDSVVLSVGVELSLFMAGIVPGATVTDRLPAVFAQYPSAPTVQRALADHLRNAAAVARSEFDGPITYGSGSWEIVDWSPTFDVVGLDLYLRPVDLDTIVRHLDPFRATARPVVATEYGCVTHHRGTTEYGADVIDWNATPPTVSEPVERDEHAQAAALGTQLDAFETARIHGAFCFVFIEPAYSASNDPRRDLDRASFGIVTPDPTDPRGWRPKAAFHLLAARNSSAT